VFLFLLRGARSLIFSFRYSRFLFLNCLLVSRLTLFRLFPFIWLGSCHHCYLALLFCWASKYNLLFVSPDKQPYYNALCATPQILSHKGYAALREHELQEAVRVAYSELIHLLKNGSFKDFEICNSLWYSPNYHLTTYLFPCLSEKNRRGWRGKDLLWNVQIYDIAFKDKSARF
jgi:hypothetical protein